MLRFSPDAGGEDGDVKQGAGILHRLRSERSGEARHGLFFSRRETEKMRWDGLAVCLNAARPKRLLLPQRGKNNLMECAEAQRAVALCECAASAAL